MIEYAFRELVRRKRRTLAHMAGYGLAAAVITLVITVLVNGRAASDAVLSGTGTHFTAFIPLCADEHCGNQPLDRENEGFYVGATRVKSLANAFLELTRTLDTVADAAPFLLFRMTNKGNGVEDLMVGGMSVADSRATATNSCSAQDVVDGRFLLPDDRAAVVVEESFAQSRYLQTGERVRLGEREFTIVGVVNTGIRMARADVYLPIEEARAVINTRLRGPLTNEGSLLLVESRNAAGHEEAVAQVKSILGAGGSISSYNCYKPASQVMGITGTSAFLITLTVFICLLAVSLQAQYGSVAERRYDIGILKSIGWSRKQILIQILWESLLKAGAGWLTGSAVAVLVFLCIPSAALMGTQTLAVKQLYPAVLLFTLVLAVTGGALAGLLPGFFAASQKPAECLRRL